MTQRAFDIEKKSFEIIDSEAGNHGYGEPEWTVVKRVIHSTADFDYCGSCRMLFQNSPISAAFDAFRNHLPIITDVEMVLAAINKKSLGDLGLKAGCYISDPRAATLSSKKQMTRSEAAMQIASQAGPVGIIAIGNAPTALLEVIKLAVEKQMRPLLVVGLPVGFVSAAESKEALAATSMSCITNRGRKGGSAAAASVINALMLLYKSAQH
jgi:precorrin-8X/cobalt-precorrin-8 methylmutase